MMTSCCDDAGDVVGIFFNAASCTIGVSLNRKYLGGCLAHEAHNRPDVCLNHRFRLCINFELAAFAEFAMRTRVAACASLLGQALLSRRSLNWKQRLNRTWCIALISSSYSDGEQGLTGLLASTRSHTSAPPCPWCGPS
jgi:hypothetical protein